MKVIFILIILAGVPFVFAAASHISLWAESVVKSGPESESGAFIIQHPVNKKFIVSGFRAVGFDVDAVVWESSNLANWTERVVASGSDIQIMNNLAYVPATGRYIASGWIGSSSPLIAAAVVWESADLISWTQRVVDADSDIPIVYETVYDSANNRYIAAGRYWKSGKSDNAAVWESADLVNWTRRKVATSSDSEVIYAFLHDTVNGKYIGAGFKYDIDDAEYDAVLWESSNLISWTKRTVDAGSGDEVIFDVYYEEDNDRYIAIGIDGDFGSWSGRDAVLWESADLVNWTRHDIDTGAGGQVPAYMMYDSAQGEYIVAGYEHSSGTQANAYSWQSPDLVSWTKHVIQSGPGLQTATGLLYDPVSGSYIAAGGDNPGGNADAVIWKSSTPVSPPTAKITCSAAPCETWKQRDTLIPGITLINNSSDPQHNIVKSKWSGINPLTVCPDEAVPALCDYTIQVNPPGSYTVELYVEDGTGLSDTDSIEVTIKQDAEADFQCSRDNIVWADCASSAFRAVKGEVIYFRGLRDDGEGNLSIPSEGASISTWEWNFGANSVPATASGTTNPSTIYTSGGNKTVSLTVVDSAGRFNVQAKTLNFFGGFPDWKETSPL